MVALLLKSGEKIKRIHLSCQTVRRRVCSVDPDPMAGEESPTPKNFR